MTRSKGVSSESLNVFNIVLEHVRLNDWKHTTRAAKQGHGRFSTNLRGQRKDGLYDSATCPQNTFYPPHF